MWKAKTVLQNDSKHALKSLQLFLSCSKSKD